jgi:rubrerythrin
MKNAKRENGGEANSKAVESLLYQLLETELGGVQIYEKAITCAINEDLKKEWEKYLEETREHVEKARKLLEIMNLDPEAENLPRQLVRTMGNALVSLIETARGQGDPEAAELVACEAVVHAETKDHMNWELLGKLAKGMDDDAGKELLEIQEEIEEQEDEHLYHTKGWTRELWLESLGLPANLPPPEEKKDVHSASEAERAEKAASRQPKKGKASPKSRLSRERR